MAKDAVKRSPARPITAWCPLTVTNPRASMKPQSAARASSTRRSSERGATGASVRRHYSARRTRRARPRAFPRLTLIELLPTVPVGGAHHELGVTRQALHGLRGRSQPLESAGPGAGSDESRRSAPAR